MSLRVQSRKRGKEAYQKRVGQESESKQPTLAGKKSANRKMTVPVGQQQELAEIRKNLTWALDGNIANQGDLEAYRKEFETYGSRAQRKAFESLEHAFAKAERQAQEAINSALINPNSSNSQINKILKSAKSLPELEALYQQAQNAGKLSNEGILKSFDYHFDRVKERVAKLQGSEAGKTVLAMESATDLNELDNLRKTAIENGTWNNEAKNAYEQQLKKQGINPSKHIKEIKQVASEVAQVPQAPHVPQVEPQVPKIESPIQQTPHVPKADPQVPKIESPIQQAPHVPQVEPQVPKIESPIQQASHVPQAPKPHVPKAGENVVSEEVQAATKNAKKFGKGKFGLIIGGALAIGATIFGLAKSCESKGSAVPTKSNTQKPEVQKHEPQKQDAPKVTQDSAKVVAQANQSQAPKKSDENVQSNLANINVSQENTETISNDSTVTISKDRPRQAYDQAFYEVAGFKYTDRNDPKVKAIISDNSKNIQILKRMHELMAKNIEQMSVDTIKTNGGYEYIQHTRVGQKLNI